MHKCCISIISGPTLSKACFTVRVENGPNQNEIHKNTSINMIKQMLHHFTISLGDKDNAGVIKNNLIISAMASNCLLPFLLAPEHKS